MKNVIRLQKTKLYTQPITDTVYIIPVYTYPHSSMMILVVYIDVTVTNEFEKGTQVQTDINDWKKEKPQ